MMWLEHLAVVTSLICVTALALLLGCLSGELKALGKSVEHMCEAINQLEEIECSQKQR